MLVSKFIQIDGLVCINQIFRMGVLVGKSFQIGRLVFQFLTRYVDWYVGLSVRSVGQYMLVFC